MNETKTFPWETMHPGQVIDANLQIPGNFEFTLVILIGEGSSPCRRSQGFEFDRERRLHDVVRDLKSRCADQNCNMCCSRPTKGIGTITFHSWVPKDQTLTVSLEYNRK